MNKSLFTLIKLRHAERAIRADKQHQPSILEGFDDEGVLGACALGESLCHNPMVQKKLNECKR